MIKITDYQLHQKIPMEPHVFFPISTLLISKKGKIFPFSQKAKPKAIKNYHLATISKISQLAIP
jgi:hypothetical protein